MLNDPTIHSDLDFRSQDSYFIENYINAHRLTRLAYLFRTVVDCNTTDSRDYIKIALKSNQDNRNFESTSDVEINQLFNTSIYPGMVILIE